MSSPTLERPGRPTVHISIGSGVVGTDDLASQLAGLLGDVLDLEGVTGRAEVGLHLVGTGEIQRLNAEHMGVDAPTDVLSFPVDGSGGADSDGDTPPPLVGDVVLCAEVARRNAASHAGTELDECRLLVVHGALHLCGWDHSDSQERAAMWARERQVMELLGVTPPKDPWGAP